MQVATETRLQHLVDMCCSWLQTAPKPNPTLLRLPRAWQNRPDQIYPSAFCLIRQMLQGILNWGYSDQFLRLEFLDANQYIFYTPGLCHKTVTGRVVGAIFSLT